MPNLNKVMLMGNITRDPEMRATPKGTVIADFGLAINRQWTDGATNEKKEEVTFVDITFFGKQAEVIGKFCKKGRPLFVEGRLELDRWEDKATGEKRSRMHVIGDTFEFLPDGKPRGEQSEAAPAKDDDRPF